MEASGVNQYGQVVFQNAPGVEGDVFLPPEDWGPTSAPVDILVGQETEKITRAAMGKIRFWKGFAIFAVAVGGILGFMYFLAIRGKTN